MNVGEGEKNGDIAANEAAWAVGLIPLTLVTTMIGGDGTPADGAVYALRILPRKRSERAGYIVS